MTWRWADGRMGGWDVRCHRAHGVWSRKEKREKGEGSIRFCFMFLLNTYLQVIRMVSVYLPL